MNHSDGPAQSEMRRGGNVGIALFAIFVATMMCASSVFIVLTDDVSSAEILDLSDELEYKIEDPGATVTGIGHKDNGMAYKVTIPSKVNIGGNEYDVTKIGSPSSTGPFMGCVSMVSISIPDSVSYIGISAFMGCSSLKSITLPNCVNTIEGLAFENCSSLTSITIPASVIYIGDSAFSSCKSLESFYVDEGNDYYYSYDGVLYGKTYGELIRCPEGRCEKITVPDDVTDIGRYAFSDCSSLESVEMSDDILYIENSAFVRCSSLKNVSMSDNVEEIGEFAFSYCSSLESITIPKSVRVIGDGAFSNCSSLKSINVADGNDNYSVDDLGILYNKDGSELICCPGNISGNVVITGVTKIHDYAFSGCSSLESITIPSDITKIGIGTFRDCSSLKSITMLGNITDINNSAFSGCSSLESLTIPGTVTKIGRNAFDGCSSLKSINIPDDVSKINDGTFNGCSSLTNISIPKGVTSIAYNAFDNCTSLGTIAVEKGNANYSSADGVLYANKILFRCPEGKTASPTISNEITSIGDYAFRGCSHLKSVSIPDVVTSIGKGAFYNCTSLESVSIPKKVSSIGSDTFNGCSSLTGINVNEDNTTFSSIDGVLYKNGTANDIKLICCPEGKTGSISIPAGVTSIENNAFGEDSSLTEINVNEDNTTFSSIDGVLYDKNAETLIHCPGGKAVLKIPDTVKNISSDAITTDKNLESVTFPASIDYISRFAFGFDFYKDDTTAITDYGELLGRTFMKNPSGELAMTTTITFDTDGGSSVDDITVFVGDEITLPSSDDCTKSGYELDGWTYNGKTYAPGENVKVTDGMSFKAVWSEIPEPGPEPEPEPEPRTRSYETNYALTFLFVIAILGVLCLGLYPRE